MMYDEECFDQCETAASNKIPVKLLELPIQKFNTVLPHLVKLLKCNHNNISKLKRLGQWEEVQREYTSASRTVQKLISVLNEMDNLKKQVANEEIDRFEKQINDSKQSAMSAIKCHQDMLVCSQPIQSSLKFDEDELKHKELQDQKLQSVANITEDINTKEQCLISLERLQGDIEDVNVIFQDLSQLVHEQKEHIETIEGNVDTTHHNVLEGEGMLCQAAKYKNTMYPLVGALIGSVVGGPIGLFAGIKFGSLTAVGCGFLGFTGGKFLKNQTHVSISEAEQHREELKN